MSQIKVSFDLDFLEEERKIDKQMVNIIIEQFLKQNKNLESDIHLQFIGRFKEGKIPVYNYQYLLVLGFKYIEEGNMYLFEKIIYRFNERKGE